MYTKEEIDLVIKTYLKIQSLRGTIRVLGYPSRTLLRTWVREFKTHGYVTLPQEREKHFKFSKQQMEQAINYYLQNGYSVTRTVRALGYPSQTLLKNWIRERGLPQQRKGVIPMVRKHFSQETKLAAVTELRRRKTPAIHIARKYGVTRTTLYSWAKEFPVPEVQEETAIRTPSQPQKSRRKNTVPSEAADQSSQARLEEALKKVSDLEKQVTALVAEAQSLQSDIYKLQLQKDVLVKCAEILKKDPGVNLDNLSNREKSLVIDALRSQYTLKELLQILKMAKSSYCYQRNTISKGDKYANDRQLIQSLFMENYQCYGYRRIKGALAAKGVIRSEKVVRRLMRQGGLRPYFKRRAKYNAFKGDPSPAVPNIVNRHFHADRPNQIWLTDITEFALSHAKVYLSPIIDCFDGYVVAWSIGTSPNAELVNTMLRDAISTLPPDAHPIVHSDRGCHYRWPEWIQIMENHGLTRSMSKKGCSPDNSACEGFFGRLKNEFFYGRPWIKNKSAEEFIVELNEYLHWYNEQRIKESLNYLSPKQYRNFKGGTYAFEKTDRI